MASRLGPLPFRLIEVAATPKGRRPRNGGPFSILAKLPCGILLVVQRPSGSADTVVMERDDSPWPKKTSGQSRRRRSGWSKSRRTAKEKRRETTREGRMPIESDKFQPSATNSPYHTCERSQRQTSRPNFEASGELFAEILAVPVIPSRREPSGFGNSTTTAK
jgi:hypothetical protein